MRLTSLNLQGFADWSERKPYITAYLKQVDPAIVLFQEVVFLPDISPYNPVQLLNQELRYSFEHSTITRLQVGVEYPVFREGLACISRYPITKTDTLILKKAPGDEHNRIVQLIDLLIDKRTVKLANVHFSLTDDVDFATAHLEETLDILKSRGEERIIAGDFNINNLEDTASLWKDHYTASTIVPYISYVSMDKRNDYVLIPNSYTFEAITVSGDGLSDHRALTIDIT